MRLFIYLIAFGLAVYLLRQIFAPAKPAKSRFPKARTRWHRKIGREVWVQVYDTDSLAEAQSFQARLEEQEISCLVYEQGRKDVHGNELKGFGISVPRQQVPLAQKVIARTPA